MDKRPICFNCINPLHDEWHIENCPSIPDSLIKLVRENHRRKNENIISTDEG